MRQGDGRCMVCNPPLVMNLYSFCFLPGVFFLRRDGGVRCGLWFWRLSVLHASLYHLFQLLRPIALTVPLFSSSLHYFSNKYKNLLKSED